MRKARLKDQEQAISSFERTRKSHSVPISEKRTTHYGNIIRRYRERQGLDQRSVGAALGYSTNTISNWENGVSRPDIDAVPKLCELLQIPLHVFFDIECDPAVPEQESSLIQDFRSLGQERRRMAAQLLRMLAEQEAKMQDSVRQIRQCVCLPVQALGVAAGTGVPNDETPEPHNAFVLDNRLARQADAIYVVNGNSMEPTYHSGDYVYVQHTPSIEQGEIGIFIVSGAAYIKEYRKTGLFSHNKAYRAMKLTDDDDVRLIGRVLGKVEQDHMMDSILQRL